MKTLAVIVATMGICVAAATAPATPPLDAPIAEAAIPNRPRPTPPPSRPDPDGVIERYCVRCHNDQRLTGNLSLETFVVEAAHASPETAEKMILKIRAGMMPPEGARQPPADTLLALVEALEAAVDAAALEPSPGVRRFQRLNRAEYQAVIRDLLDLEVDAGRWLPLDTYLGNFDNMSAAQALSATLVEAYLRAATDVSRRAIGNPDATATTTKYTNSIDVSQHAWDHIEGTPFGTRGGIVVTHDFPADGDYVFSVETLFGAGTGFEDLDVSIDGEGVALLPLQHNGESILPIRTRPIFVRAGQHRVAAAFVRKIEGPYEDRLSPHGWSFAGGEDSQAWANYGITVLPHLQDLIVTGPLRTVGVSSTPSHRKIFSCYPSSTGEERACAESIVSRLASQAYRRPVGPDDVAGPMSFYDDAAAESGFEVGVRAALQAILASPSFVFRLERVPPGVSPGASYRLGGVELASKLSFFLWGTSPDEDLLALAAQGGLSDEAVLRQQVARMLSDPRSEAIATRFASQWLRLQDAAKNEPEPYLYPDFTGQLRNAMVSETQLLFEHLVREDGSFLELFTADYTYLNEILADHYGIGGVSGSEFRRVAYPEGVVRRGLLGHGSVLLLTSMSDRTSPVLRGKWVLEVLMGTPPPPPPPNVPAFEATEGADAGRVLTTRERLERHRSDPTCNACHRLMDPIGLALDNFDVAGRWRDRENGMTLDTRGTFYDGTPVSTPQELVDVLLDRPIPLARNFAANMLAFATGRRVEYFDQPTIRKIANEAQRNDYRMSTFILGVIMSDPFQMVGSEAASQTAAGQGRQGP